MPRKDAGFREDDSWFSEEQLAKVAPADEVEDHLRSPIPTQMVSNGEYMPHPQTENQKHVEHRITELADMASKKLGVSRRQFLASSGGMAAAFLAMNEVFGRFFDVSPIEMFEPEAYAATGTPPNLFIVDDQLHINRSTRTGPGGALRDIAAGRHTNNNPLDLPDELGRINYPWNPLMVTDPNDRSSWHLPNFIKWVYLDSQVTVGIMTNNNNAALPDGSGGTRPPKNVFESEAAEGLTAEQTMAARNFINRVAGSRRALGQGQLYPGVGNLDYMRYQIEELEPDCWKGYNIARAAKVDFDPDSDMRRWRMDDEQVAYPMYEVINSYATKERLKKYPGFLNLSVHKGLSTAAGPEPELGHPMDIPKAATDWPEFNFIYYHACIRPGFWVLNALNDVRSGRLRNALNQVGAGVSDGVPDILWTTEMAVLAAPFNNVYAEIGTTFASCVITFPTVCAHLLGQIMKFMGEDRLVFGSDSVHYGSPQWQIDAFWRFQIPDDIRKRWGYPALTNAAKRKILGLNSARIYKLPPAAEVSPYGVYRPVPANYESLIDDETKRIMEFPGYARDNFSRMRKMYAEAGGKPDNIRRGWIRTRV